MFRRRFALAESSRPMNDPTPSPAAFFLCPLACLPSAPDAARQWQQALYEWAFEQARQVVRPSILERDLLGVWN